MEGKIEIIDIEDVNIEMTCEIATVKIKTGKQSLYIIGIYRTDRNLEEGLEAIYDSLDRICAEKHPTILMGDINIDCLDKGNDYYRLRDVLNCHSMYRIDLPPTRITATSISSIDSVCTNIKEEEIKVEIIDAGISDHTGQMCRILRDTGPTTKQSTTKRRNMNDRNLHNLKDLLKQENWDEVYNTDNVNEAYVKFNNILQQALNNCCPYMIPAQRKKTNMTVLCNPAVAKIKQEFLKAQNTYQTTGTEEHKIRALSLKKEYDLQLRHLRKQDNINKIQEANNKSKAIWNVINSERKKKDETTQLNKLKIQDQELINPKEIADYLNTFFTSIAEETIRKSGILGSTTALPESNRNHPSLVLSPTSRQEMTKTIRSIQTKTSTGYDDISSKLIKLCEDEIRDPLIDITNKSLSSGIFPSALKLTKVYPKFKQGLTTDAANYRPISLIPTISKIIEKLVLARLFEHLLSNHLLTPHQHGFLAGKSTTTALISLVEFILDQQESGSNTSAIFLDYSKAFDCLDHKYLLNKLASLGIQGTAKAWFTSYLTGRSQIVEIKHSRLGRTDKVNSDPKPITRGVPQGSVLGPVLFILFTNDFPEFMQGYSKTLMYADDTVLLLSSQKPEQLEVDSYVALNMAIQYCHKHELVVNENKTKHLILGRQGTSIETLPGLDETTTLKYLGITLDNKLSWTSHIDHLCSKLSTALFVIRRMTNISDMTTSKTAYYALFESHLRYGIAVWGGTTVGNLQRVLVLQKRAIRLLKKLQPRESCRQAFKELQILTVINVYVLEVVLYIHIKAPETAKTGAQTHCYNTRFLHNYHLPAHKHSSTEKKPSYIGAKIWNTLPEQLKRTEQSQFGQQLKKWLQDRPFYSLTEFFNWRTNMN